MASPPKTCREVPNKTAMIVDSSRTVERMALEEEPKGFQVMERTKRGKDRVGALPTWGVGRQVECSQAHAEYKARERREVKGS